MNKTLIDRSFSFKDGIYVLLWLGILFITWTFMHGADHYLQLTPEALGRYFPVRWFLLMHITSGGGALVLGPLQFWKRLQSSKRLHRVVGYLYLLAILASSLCAVVLASTTAYAVNWAYAFSLQIWVSVWITTTGIAWWLAVKQKFKQHKDWMIRSYLVTLAFVVSGLILKMPVIYQLGDFASISPSFFWLGWALPLYVYEMVKAVRLK
ncbi:DUF2306 domain-containing protein [Chitinophaga oryzae]|uniref:DUF2306 domain-containing protein n=1 Tax=Chitinophaga oryzae TaxID=2725414 RepID=A0AAE6ZHH4_9BACT|nr:DUF2306 domain-containing protein [Chitinophaga oryzae]QJB31869.1 DUF2306 domain-containing protein [Chitinophaga oryzae]QJB38346.1 DUF2306 domain-containing protein [Chitinophaga oryzae]